MWRVATMAAGRDHSVAWVCLPLSQSLVTQSYLFIQLNMIMAPALA